MRGNTQQIATMVAVSLMTSGLLLDPATAGGGTAGPVKVQSPSGLYVLTIRPEDEYLRTGARYTFTREGRQIWSGRKPYTLRIAGVTDDGRVAGVAYRTAKRRPAGGGKRKEYFHVVILDPAGKELLNEVTERRPGPVVDIGVQATVPTVSQVLVDPDNDRVIIRGLDDDTPGPKEMDFWWIYRLSDGKSIKRYRPMTNRTRLLDRVREMVQIALVPGTPLVVVHWRLPILGARFTLVTPDGSQVWELDLEEEYAALSGTTKGNLDRYLAANPAILPSDKPGRFALRFLGSGERVTYSVEQVAKHEWDVREVSRVDYPSP